MNFIIGSLILLAIMLIAITIHEFSHALAAEILGDPTPKFAGRLSLNPLRHIDPLGLVMLFVARLGWAKPVPINPYNFRDPQRGEMLVAFAGPLSNFFAAWLVATIFKLLPSAVNMNMVVVSISSQFIFINLSLAVFNLLPIPPLDGSTLLRPFLPEDIREMLEQYGFFILIFLLLFPATNHLLYQAIIYIFKIVVQ
jgi:Zn-dependent protease